MLFFSPTQLSKAITAILLLPAASLAAQTTWGDYWEDQTVFAVNKEDAHATTVPYASVAELKADKAFFDTPWTQTGSSRVNTLTAHGNSIL